MQILLVYTHPNPKSFNHAVKDAVLAEIATAGHAVDLLDLYAERPKCVLDAEDFGTLAGGGVPEDVRAYQARVVAAEALIFVYPIWWFDRPALLKGWIDRVFIRGFGFEFLDGGMPQPLLVGRRALVLTTAGGPEAVYKATKAERGIHTAMAMGTLGYCGIAPTTMRTFYEVPWVDDAARRAMLDEARGLARAFLAGEEG